MDAYRQSILDHLDSILPSPQQGLLDAAAKANAGNDYSYVSQLGTGGSGGGSAAPSTGFHPLDTVWNFLKSVYGDAQGALAGGIAPFSNTIDQMRQHGTGAQYVLPDVLSMLKDIPDSAAGLVHGMLHPAQGQAALDSTLQDAPAIDRFVTQTASDPLMYLPVGAVARATGIAPATKFLLDLAKGTVKSGEGAAPAANILEDLAKTQTQASDVGRFALPEPARMAEEIPQAGRSTTTFTPTFDTKAVLPPELSGLPALRNATEDFTQGAGLGRAGQARNIVDAEFSPIKEVPQAEQAAGEAAGNAAAASQRGPYAAYDWQSKLFGGAAKGLADMAPNGIPGLKQVFDNPLTNKLGEMFTKYYGASPALANALKNADVTHGSNLTAIMNSLADMKAAHGLNPQEMRDVVGFMEGTKTVVSDKVKQAASDLQNVLTNGIDGHAFGLGKNAELATKVNGQPVLKSVIENYFPHIYNNSQKAIRDAFDKLGPDNPTFDLGGAFNKERQFQTVNQALAAGLKPELDPYMAVGQRLAKSSRALTHVNLLNDIKQGASGISVSPQVAQRVVKQLKTGELAPENNVYKGYVQSKIPQMNGHYLSANDDRALSQALRISQNTNNPLVRGYDWSMRKYKGGMFFNPAVHGHNVLYNGMYLAGANPKYVFNNLRDLQKTGSNEWIQRAQNAGAISADRGAFKTQLNRMLNQNKPKGLVGNAWDKFSYATHGVLWDLDKAVRSSIFRDAVESGATDAEAATKANKFLVDYNNMTPFEESVMSRIFPFYRWIKGNMPLQVEQWYNNTPKQMIYETMKNATNQALTGQNIGDDGKIDTGIVLSDGSHVKVDPYAPADEPLKALHEGPLSFLYGRSSPLLKEAATQFTNRKYYPTETVAPDGKEGMANSDPSNKIRLAGAPASYNAGQTMMHLLENIASPAQGAIGQATDPVGKIDAALLGNQHNKPGTDTVEFLTRLLGGFPSRDNPQKDAYFSKKNAQTDLLNYIQYLHNTGQPVPPQTSKAAYKKIKY